MKKFFCAVLALSLFAGIFAGCGNAGGETKPAPDMEFKLGETGVVVTLPGDLGFGQMESSLNDYFGVGGNGEWCIIVNQDEKSDYTLEEYAKLTAEANDSNRVQKDADGNYYFIYKNDEYHFYTAIRETQDSFYRVAFYCFKDVWGNYSERFAQWATTIEIK